MSEILYNSRGQPYQILETYKKGKNYWCKIQFLNTGYTYDVRKSSIAEGYVKDRYAPDVCGVACIGNVSKVDNLRAYTLWKNMIDRCYNKDNKAYRWYGGLGTTVSDRWLCFEYFLEDLPSVDGYDEVMFNDGLLELDKDLKINKKERASVGLYSLETCTFMTHNDNIKLIDNVDCSHKNPELPLALATKNNHTEEVYNIQEFCKVNELSKSAVYRRLSGKITSPIKGWTIERKNYYYEK